MQKWEYLVIFIHDAGVESTRHKADSHANADAFTERLNSYGQAGWELVNFEWEEAGAKAAFKRPLEAQSPKTRLMHRPEPE